jgi:hypothetical protein
MKRIAIVIGLGMALGILIAPSAQAEWWEFWESSNEAKAKAEFERVKRDYKEAEVRIQKEDEEKEKQIKEQALATKKTKKERSEFYIKESRKYLEEYWAKKDNLSYETIKRYEKIVEKYPKTEIADDCLYKIVEVLRDINVSGAEVYLDALRYAKRLCNEYPKSKLGEEALFFMGLSWAGAGIFPPMRPWFLDPYIELINRYPNSKYAVTSLIAIVNSEPAEYRPGIDVWAYNLLMTIYKNKQPAFSPSFFKDKKIFMGVTILAKMHLSQIKDSGGEILSNYGEIIKYALFNYKAKNGFYPKGEITNGNTLNEILSQYFTDNEGEKVEGFNPFIPKDGWLYYKSDGKRFELKLKVDKIESLIKEE